MRRVSLILGLLICLPSVAGADVAEAVIFGDSLSDVGNLSQASFGLYPGPYYYNGRTSNGPVYAEHFYSGLGFGTLTRSLAGGNGFAYAGARTTGTGGFDGLFIRDLDEQVTTYLSSRTPTPETLFVVLIGANDLVNQLGGGGGTSGGYVTNLMSDINRLRTAGARQLLISNLPDLGLVPRYNSTPASAQAAHDATVAFNTALESALDQLEAGNPALTIFRMDLFRAFNEIVASPGSFGLVNVTDPAAPGLEVGDASYDTSQIVSNPHEYLFWDELHPTAAGHVLLGQYALSSIPEPAVGAVVLFPLVLLRRRRAA